MRRRLYPALLCGLGLVAWPGLASAPRRRTTNFSDKFSDRGALGESCRPVTPNCRSSPMML